MSSSDDESESGRQMRKFSAYLDALDRSQSLREHLSRIYEDIGWPSEWINEDLAALSDERITSVNILQMLDKKTIKQVNSKCSPLCFETQMHRISPILRDLLSLVEKPIISAGSSPAIASVCHVIGLEQGWTREQIEADVAVFHAHRILTIDHAKKIASKKTFKVIALEMPALALQHYRAVFEGDNLEKFENLCISKEKAVEAFTTILPIIQPRSKNGKERDCLPVPKQSSNEHLTFNLNTNRINVTSRGRHYHVDRYCPHKGADLSRVHGMII